jgi:sodium/potassium/calcium exchanger 6
VTFLAFGNSAPDLFSTLVAINSESIDMAMGELIGAGLFVGGIVVGAVALTARSPRTDGLEPGRMVVQLERNVFLRDVGFLLLSVFVFGGVLADGKLVWWEGLLMLLVYSTC